MINSEPMGTLIDKTLLKIFKEHSTVFAISLHVYIAPIARFCY